MISFYPFIASTELTFSESISFSIFSIPFFRVTVDEGHPLQAPCSITFTNFFSASYESKRILPPSDATAGLIYSSRIETIFLIYRPDQFY